MKGTKGVLVVVVQLFDVLPGTCMVEMSKTKGDTLEFYQFYNSLRQALKPIMAEPGTPSKAAANAAAAAVAAPPPRAPAPAKRDSR